MRPRGSVMAIPLSWAAPTDGSWTAWMSGASAPMAGSLRVASSALNDSLMAKNFMT